MRLGYEASGSLVWILGGGMMRDLSQSSAYRVEVRLLSSTTKACRAGSTPSLPGSWLRLAAR